MVINILFKFQYNILQANSGEPDQTPRSAASDLGLRRLPVSNKKDAMRIWVKMSLGIYIILIGLFSFHLFVHHSGSLV